MMRNNTTARFLAYDERVSTTKFDTANGSACAQSGLNSSASIALVSIDNDGFKAKVGGSNHAGEYYYFAIG